MSTVLAATTAHSASAAAFRVLGFIVAGLLLAVAVAAITHLALDDRDDDEERS